MRAIAAAMATLPSAITIAPAMKNALEWMVPSKPPSTPPTPYRTPIHRGTAPVRTSPIARSTMPNMKPAPGR